jgi:hypothetical protein
LIQQTKKEIVMRKRNKVDFDSIFSDIFTDEIERRRIEASKPRNNVFILLGKLGLRHGKQKILGIYPTATQAEKRRIECEKNHDTLFRKYMVAQVSVACDGVDCDLEF